MPNGYVNVVQSLAALSAGQAIQKSCQGQTEDSSNMAKKQLQLSRVILKKVVKVVRSENCQS